MPVIPQATIEQVRNASDIVDVIGSYVPLKRAGTNFIGLCPFHKEKTPSFNVSPSKQIFHCFGCHKGGDVFSFLREFENLTFVETVQRLAERARIPIEFEMTPGQREEGSLKEKLRSLHEQVAKRWESALANDGAAQIARDYLAKRGVS
ncbi:MAG TPA: DNA primase, partial [Verrucomicrobiales bacterium]|nr:DNA primase [Verrucomicrobiales bacterium]